MKKCTKGILFLLLFSNFSFAQQSGTSNSDNPSIISTDSTNNFIARPPTIGLGTGLFSFFGDVGTKNFQSPALGRIAYELIVSQNISENFQLNFNVLFGTLEANERNAGSEGTRNLNFQSKIRAGGLNMQYNFGNFLPKDRIASPFISLGVEAFEFNSKTDAKDKDGNAYYYWSDGTIRNIDQHSPDAHSAKEIKRDYSYETDIREQNKDGFGKYSTHSFAIPLGVGAVFKINDFIYLKLGTTMHFTFTDYIDGVTFMSKGNRQGNNKYDNFMMTSCSIHYNFGTARKTVVNFSDDDYTSLDLNDTDKDGVPDPLDLCQGTPSGVTVDKKGCPLDDDKDGVPNYKDKELHSPPNSYVDINGTQLNDSLIALMHNRYLDTTMAYAEIKIAPNVNEATSDPNKKTYTIVLGTFKTVLPADLMNKYLKIQATSSENTLDGTTTYMVGRFDNFVDANIRKEELIRDGLTNIKIVYKQNGKYYDVPEK